MLKGTIPSLGKIGNSQEIVSDYLDELLGLVTKTQGNIDVTVGIDQGGGAVCNYVEQLFKKLGVQFCCVNDSPGIFSRDPDPTVDELNDLRTLVLANNLDFGFAFDLDGDRLVVVNKNGIKLNPDSTLLMSIGGALDMGMKKFVTSIDTSVAVEKLIKSHHGRCDYSKVGESNVVKKMLEIHADAGGEGSSGGFILPGFNNCRDGMLAASTIACMNRSTINECLKLALEYSQIRLKIPVEPDSQMKLLDRLLDTLRSESSQILMIDGVKAIIDEDSWVLVRPSNTEDVIRLSLESKANNIQTLHKKILERIKFVVEHVK
jgi:phosphomannomutase